MIYRPIPGWLTRYGNPGQLLRPQFSGRVCGLWLPFASRGGNILIDVSRNANHGVFPGGASNPSHLMSTIGPVMDFSSDYTNAGNNGSLDVTTTFSMVALAIVDGVGNNSAILSRWGSGDSNQAYIWGPDDSGEMALYTQSDSAQEQVKASTDVLTGQWVTVGVTHNAGTTTFYMDGEPDGTHTSHETPHVTPEDLLVGGTIGDYNGKLAYVLLTTITLSDGEMLTIARNPWNTLFRNPDLDINLRAVAAGTTDIEITWTDNAENESGFTIERQTDGGAWTTVVTGLAPDTESYNENMEEGHTYNYRVKATSATLGDSEWSNEDDVTV